MKMDFEQLLNETRYTTTETAERLKPLFLENGEYQKIIDRYRFEIEKMKAKYKQAEYVSYAVRHVDTKDKFGRKVSINNQFDNITLEELNKLKDSLVSQEEQTIDSGFKR